MNNRSEVKGCVSSEKGFYVGDICYALRDDIYHGFWGNVKHFDDGVFDVPTCDGMSFAVGSTACGDGCYPDQLGHAFPVDAGNIGVVPIELVKDMDKAIDLGLVVDAPGTATFESVDGIFNILLPDGQTVEIDTHFDGDEYEDDDDEDDYYDDEEGEDEDDDF